jgi:organic radical activating enzyme
MEQMINDISQKPVHFNKGKIRSSETKEKIRQTIINQYKNGKIPWNKDKHHSEETKKKISLSKKGKYLSEESIIKMKETKRNNPNIISLEQKIKIGLAQKGKPKSEETKRKLSLANTGHHHTEETKSIISKRSQLMWNDPNSKINSEETRKKLMESQFNNSKKNIYGIKCSNIYGEKFQSISEMSVANYFRSSSIKYNLHTPIKFDKNFYIPDFYLPDSQLYIEYFGSIWRTLHAFVKKINDYTKNNISFIGLYSSDLKDLDYAMSCIDKRMNISEVFFSACGEGREQGKLATFIRSYSCNRTCLYCDTKYSLKGEYKSLSIRQILDLIYFNGGNSNCKKVFLTGGEITIQENFKYLVETLYRHKIETILQTNGTTFLPDEFDKVTWLSVDIKGPSSGKLADQNIIENIYQKYSGIDKKLDDFKTQFKYVVSNEEDYIYAKQNVLKYPNVVHLLQPEWNSFQEDRTWLANRMLYDNEIRKNFSDVRLSLQMHKFYGLK